MQLPLDCEALYYTDFLSGEESERLFAYLGTMDSLIQPQIFMLEDGTENKLDTGTYLFLNSELTDHPAIHESFGDRAEWPPLMRVLKEKVEAKTGREFAVCRCIYYPDGKACCGFHSDYPAYGSVSYIASVSLGAEREFAFRSKEEESSKEYRLQLKNGSLLIMGKNCQELYEHALPADETCQEPRINLTFRFFGWN